MSALTHCAEHSWPCSVDVGFLVQNDIQQRGVDFDWAVVANQAQFSKFVHEKAYAGARRTNHRERLLADLGDDWLGSTVLTKISEKEEGPCQALLAGIEQLIDQVCFNPDSAPKRCETNISEKAGSL